MINTIEFSLMPARLAYKNPFNADRIVLKDGGVIERSDGVDIIKVSDDGSTTTITGTEEILPGEIPLTDGNFLVGNASAVAADVTMSGDATLANTGAVTVVSAAAAFQVNDTFTSVRRLLFTGTTTTSGPGAVALTGSTHEITTTATGNALTLADGAAGQHLYVVYVAEGAGADTGILTPDNLAGANTTVTFNDIGDSAHLVFNSGTWFFLGGEAVVAV